MFSFYEMEVVTVAGLGADQIHHVGLGKGRKECAELDFVGSVQRIEQHFKFRVGHAHKVAVIFNRLFRLFLQLSLKSLVMFPQN